MNTRSGLRGAALAAFFFILPATAAAQGYPPPPPPGGGPGGPGPAAAPAGDRDAQGFWQRRGIYGGIGLGGGSMQYESPDGSDTESEASVALHFDVGFQLNPRLGLVLDGWGLGFNDSEFADVTYTHAIVTIGAQYWITPMLYARGGVGSARFAVNVDGEEVDGTDTVLGYMLGAGIEALSSPNFSVDVEGRIGSGFYDDGTLTNISVSVAVRWHSLWGGAVVVVH